MSATAREWVYTLVGSIAGFILGLALSMVDFAGIDDRVEAARMLAVVTSLSGFVVARWQNSRIKRQYAK